MAGPHLLSIGPKFQYATQERRVLVGETNSNHVHDVFVRGSR